MAEQFNLSLTGEEVEKVLTDSKTLTEAKSPSLNEISSFICVNKEGNAIGMMSKEQVAQVVGGLLPLVTLNKNGLYPYYKAQMIPIKKSISSSGVLRLLKHNTMGAWTSMFIEIASGQGTGGAVGKVIISVSSDASESKGVSAAKVGSPSIEIYKDDEYVYIKNTFIYNTTISIQADDVFPLEESSTIIELPASAVKVEYS